MYPVINTPSGYIPVVIYFAKKNENKIAKIQSYI